MTPVSKEHVEVTPDVCGGRPRIAGHRIRVQDVVIWHERERKSPEEIIWEFPQITLADVHAALAYYFDHRRAIDDQIGEDEALAAEMRGSSPPLAKRDAEGSGSSG